MNKMMSKDARNCHDDDDTISPTGIIRFRVAQFDCDNNSNADGSARKYD
jgi:hypothetical protein